jgi:Flp pilus assembly protein TadD
MNYALLGRPADAAALYAQSAEQTPGDAELAYQAALWSQRAGRHDEARGFAQRAADLGNEQARSMLARMDEQD